MPEASDVRPDPVWPDPVEGAPLTARAGAELALAAALREASDFARAMVPSAPTPEAYRGTLVADARRLTGLAGRALAAAIAVERADGTPWPEIARAIGDEPGHTREHWEPMVRQWDVVTEQAAIPQAPEDADDPPGSVETTTAELDAWIVRHREADAASAGSGEPAPDDRPLSDALARMDPYHELLHLAAVRRRLATLYDGSSPPARLLDLVEREAVLEEHLAAEADPADRADHERAAARARTVAAHLRARSDGGDLPAG